MDEPDFESGALRRSVQARLPSVHRKGDTVGADDKEHEGLWRGVRTREANEACPSKQALLNVFYTSKQSEETHQMASKIRCVCTLGERYLTWLGSKSSPARAERPGPVRRRVTVVVLGEATLLPLPRQEQAHLIGRLVHPFAQPVAHASQYRFALRNHLAGQAEPISILGWPFPASSWRRLGFAHST